MEFGMVMNEAAFKGKTAIVTGSATGIGAAVTLRLGREGANIVVNFAKSEADFQSLDAVNVIGAFQMVRAAIAPLRRAATVRSSTYRRSPTPPPKARSTL